ncbi:MAG: DegT/DnrJ/EryC1/StrS family aminotransferase [Planctomycetes bacterium]|jgi:dTDP-4-amino-4,6-dideoxygalactose transaminase|nr:DegT/DnrJ/EryC1/StrS family aminotransferase [Planctomycetota bacterium]
MNPVPMFDYRAQLESLRGEMMAAIARVLDSGTLILGPEVERFEQAMARSLGGGTTIGCNSGTDALVLAFRALGIGAGDQIVTVANTAVPTVSAIRMVGAVPVFVDVDPRTALMDLDRLPAVLGPRTKAIVPVHLYGNMVDVEALRERLRGRELPIIEDCAQAQGASLRGRPAGTIGTIGAYSFYPTKNLGAYGDGGACWTADPALAARMKSLRMYGFEDAYYAERDGINSRLDPLQAAVLATKLPHLPAFVALRQQLAARYDERLPPRIVRIAAAAGVAHGRHLYVVRVPDRDAVRAALDGRGIKTGVHYPFPIHRMRAYAELGYADGSLPHTEALAREVLSLPLFPELPQASVDQVAAALDQVVR